MLKKSFFKPLFIFLTLLLSACGSQFKTVKLLKGHTRTQHEAFSDKIMIATQGEAATQAGIKMIELGGNAFDAAAAVSFAISVERSQSTGLGGGGFMLMDGPNFKHPLSLDFREKAPLKAHSKMYVDKKDEIISRKSLDGIFAGGVPGVVKGVLEMQAKYGKLTRQQVMQPAIDLAENGFKIYPHLAKAIEARQDVLKQYPASTSVFFKTDGGIKKEGDILIQKDLAKTLKTISDKGVNGFYKGWVAQAIVNESKRLGGYIQQTDLDKYNTKWRTPVHGTFKDYEIFSMAPPSSGGTHVIQILNTLEAFNLKEQGIQSPTSIHQTATAMQLAFVDRARYMGDADFVKVPVNGLISKKYAKELHKKIGSKALKLEQDDLLDAFPYESDETTHFTIMDSAGNTVSSTQTINGWLGSGVVIPGTGIVMNNEMDDFSKKPGDSNLFGAVGSKNNLVEPEKRPLSSMSPTIVRKDGKPVLALGTPSGTRILTCVSQVLLNYLEYEKDLYTAVAALRYHHQWKPDHIRVEEPGFSLGTKKALQSMGHEINHKDLGCKVQAVAFENNRLHGVADPRGEGLAKGK